ncbi:MAG: ATP synthase F1 subunit delta [Candidatus Uhrbacteria bacterium]|nr:ATP synthase F1 subunit delta [Candidatus Uhrbacteria bacterium]
MAKSFPLRAYAQAYISSHDRADLFAAYEDFRRAANVIQRTPKLSAFLSDQSIHERDRERAIDIACPALNKQNKNFLLLLAHAKLLKRLDRMLDSIEAAMTKAEKISIARVTSAIELTAAETKKIIQTLSTRTGMDITIKQIIDPQIIGGLHIRIADWEFDATVKGRLERIKHTLRV